MHKELYPEDRGWDRGCYVLWMRERNVAKSAVPSLGEGQIAMSVSYPILKIIKGLEVKTDNGFYFWKSGRRRS